MAGVVGVAGFGIAAAANYSGSATTVDPAVGAPAAGAGSTVPGSRSTTTSGGSLTSPIATPRPGRVHAHVSTGQS